MLLLEKCLFSMFPWENVNFQNTFIDLNISLNLFLFDKNNFEIPNNLFFNILCRRWPFVSL